MWLDEDDAGGPLGTCRRSQILEAGGEKSMKKTDYQTEQTKTLKKTNTNNNKTHNFGGDVGVRQVPVLTHDGQVAVDVDGQSVSSQDHDTVHTQTQQEEGQELHVQVHSV